MRKLLIFVTSLLVLFLVGVRFSQAQARPPICLDPKGHLVWPGQTASTIPMRSPGTTDTLANSPVSVSGSNVSISTNVNVTGDVSATGNVTGANICVGGNCVNSWSQVSGTSFWTQSGSNLFPNTLSWNVGIGTNAPTVKLDVNGDIRAANLTLSGNLTNNVLRLTPQSTEPAGQAGMIYFNSAGSGKFRCFNNTSWQDCGGGQAVAPPGPAWPFQVKDPAGNLVLEVNQE